MTVVDQSNVLNFYSQFFFNPPVPITGFPPVNSIIWFQGIGIVHPPLSVGTHTLQLDAVNTQAAFGSFFEYHNTWTVRCSLENGWRGFDAREHFDARQDVVRRTRTSQEPASFPNFFVLRCQDFAYTTFSFVSLRPRNLPPNLGQSTEANQ